MARSAGEGKGEAKERAYYGGLERKHVEGQKWESVSFSSGGDHLIYEVGAATEMLRKGVKAKYVYGSSAGGITALFYWLDLREELTLKMMMDMLPSKKRRSAGIFDALWRGSSESCRGIELLRQRVMELIRNIFKKRPGLYKELKGHVFLALTSFPDLKEKCISDWKSDEDFLGALEATTWIPGVTAPFLPPKYRGGRYMDGGFANVHPIRDKDTVCVSTQPFTARPWSRAAKKKTEKPEIFRHVDEEDGISSLGSMAMIKNKMYYKRLYRCGEHDAGIYIASRALQHQKKESTKETKK